jgi:OOP family OmpA-OmpF porin
MNKSKAGWVVLGLAAAAFAGQAAAQDEGYYLGASVGESQFRKSCSGITAACDDKDLGWRVFGGYHLNRIFSVEVGYANLGEATTSADVREVKALDVSAIGGYHFTPEFALLARIGMYRGQTTRSTVLGTAGDHNTGFTYGLGLRYAFTRGLALRAEWQQYESAGGAATGKDNVGALSAGVVVSF